MPEGPSLVIVREETTRFVGKKIVLAEGNTKAVDLDSLAGKRITSLRSWGKHFIIEMKGANQQLGKAFHHRDERRQPAHPLHAFWQLSHQRTQR